MHIAIAGNIGVGKTTLTKLLAKHYGWTPHFENVTDNPYINDFYHEMERWSFNMQMHFLSSRFKKVKDIINSDGISIQDRTIYEDANIFAPNLHDMKLMSKRDYDNYKSLFSLIESFIKAPDLLIYLRADISTLVDRIRKRGREYENTISIEYLSRLNERYEAWISNYKKGNLLIIDVNNNFVGNEDVFNSITSRIKPYI